MMAFHPANFKLPRPLRSQVRSRHAIDRWTDRQTTAHQFIMPHPYTDFNFLSLSYYHIFWEIKMLDFLIGFASFFLCT